MSQAKLPRLAGFRVTSGLIKPPKPIRPKRIDTGLYHGKTVQFGNTISFSEKKSRRTWKPNVQEVKLYSETLDTRIRLKATTAAIRTVEKKGGLDNYLLRTKEAQLDSRYALELKAIILQAKKENAAAQELKDKIEYHAKALVAQAKNDKELATQILSPPKVTQVDEKLRQALEVARQQVAADKLKKRNLLKKLMRGQKKTKTSRYASLKPKMFVSEYKMPPQQREKLRSLDTTRLDRIYRGELAKNKSKVDEEATKVDENAPTSISEAIKLATSGELTNKVLQEILAPGSANKKKTVKPAKKDKKK
jgi:large subunit ribosomal protein L28